MRLTRLAVLVLAITAACSEPEAPVVDFYDAGELAGQLPSVIDALTSGDPERALAELDALALQPDAPEGLDHFRGLALLDADRAGEAVAAFEAELALHPGNGMAHAFLAEALLALGEIPAARKHLEIAGEAFFELSYLDFLNGRAALLAEEDAAAAEAFQRFVTDIPTGARAAEAHAGLAQIARRMGQSQAADFHLARSQHLEQAGQFLNAYRQKLAENPDDAMAALGVGMVFLNLYREVTPDPRFLGQANDAFEATLERDPENLKALYNLGFIRTVENRGEEAQALHDRALALAPDHGGVLFNSGLLAGQMGDIERALDHLDRAANAADSDGARAQARLARADVFEAQGRLDEALAELTVVMQLDPSDPHGVGERLTQLNAARDG